MRSKLPKETRIHSALRAALTVSATAALITFHATASASANCNDPNGSGARIVKTAEAAQQEKMSDRINKFQELYRKYTNISRMCRSFMDNISISGIAQAANIPLPVPNPAVHVLIEEFVVPEINDKARDICRQVTDTLQKEIRGFEKKAMPPVVRRTAGEIEDVINKTEREAEKRTRAESQNMFKAASYNEKRAANFAPSPGAIAAKQQQVMQSVTTSKEYQAFKQRFEQSYPLVQVPSVNVEPTQAPTAPSTQNQRAPQQQPNMINQSLNRSKQALQPAPSRTPVQQPSSSTQTAPDAQQGEQQQRRGYVPPSSRQQTESTAPKSESSGSFYSNFFGGR